MSRITITNSNNRNKATIDINPHETFYNTNLYRTDYGIYNRN